MSVSPAVHSYRTWMIDSDRWNAFQPRDGDVVIATYPKSGTTWMQQIVSLLIFQSPEPRPVGDMGAWIDRRLDPLEDIMRYVTAQTHRRFLKSHVPFDGMPIHDNVRYIHVARDGRDVCLSYHNQITRFRADTLRALDAAGLSDDLIGRPYPAIPKDARDYFRFWLSEGVAGATDGSPFLSFFDFERTYWEARKHPNVLMVHYRDLKADLDGEMRRIARFLDIPVDETVWGSLVQAATFEAMRRDGNTLAPRVMKMFSGGAIDFFQKGENDRWRGVLADADLALYERTVNSKLAPGCAHWLRNGRAGVSELGLVEV